MLLLLLLVVICCGEPKSEDQGTVRLAPTGILIDRHPIGTDQITIYETVLPDSCEYWVWYSQYSVHMEHKGKCKNH